MNISSLNSIITKNLTAKYGQTNPIAGNNSNINSIFGAKDLNKSGETKDTKNEQPIDGTETPENKAKTDKIFDNLSFGEQLKIIDKSTKILDNSQFGELHEIGTQLKNKSEDIKGEANKILGEVMKLTVSGGSEEEVSSKLNELLAKAQQLKNKMNNLTTKAQQSERLNEKLSNYAAKGGDTDKIDLKQVSQDIIGSLDNESSASGTDKASAQDPTNDKLAELEKILDGSNPNGSSEYIKKDNTEEETNNTANGFNFLSNNLNKKKNPFITTKTPLF